MGATDLEAKVSVLVVLYKTNMKDSATILGLMSQRDINFAVDITFWDNSPTSVYDAEVVQRLRGTFRSISYRHTPENVSLSKVYNSHISEDNADVFVIFDQDSLISDHYICSIWLAINANPTIPLFAPQVFSGGRLISPGNFKLFKGVHIDHVDGGLLSSSGITVIMSGIAVRRSVVTAGINFNESLWLYAVDTDFFLRFRELYKSIWVLDERIDHDSALRSDLKLDQRVFRFYNLRWSYLRMHLPSSYARLLMYIYLVFLSARHAVKYRSFRFMTGWSNNGRK